MSPIGYAHHVDMIFFQLRLDSGQTISEQKNISTVLQITLTQCIHIYTDCKTLPKFVGMKIKYETVDYFRSLVVYWSH